MTDAIARIRALYLSAQPVRVTKAKTADRDALSLNVPTRDLRLMLTHPALAGSDFKPLRQYARSGGKTTLVPGVWLRAALVAVKEPSNGT